MPEDPRLLQAFLEQSPVSRFMVDREFVFRAVYGDSTPILGKPAPELRDRPVAGALEPEQALVWRERFERALAGESLSLRERRGAVSWHILVFPIRLDRKVRYAAASA